ncbi:hypothetical protein RND81_06G067100 [Saponaria officinalis]|uniref:Uncharacterized protein n=1 Tax=Saponaria officinalis TaxID=3572 RepID=A0AAW1KAL3_SAPOF
MSLWRLIVNKAVEEGNRNMSNFPHIHTIVDNVILNASHVVSGGATLFHDHIGAKIRQRLKHVVEKVESDSISCHGKERIMFLQKVLSSLQQIERLNAESIVLHKHQVLEQDKKVDDYMQLTQVSNYNSTRANSSNEALNFYEVLIQSKAIEGILLSMILEPPDHDEINIVLEIFRISIIEGKEVHIMIMHWIQNLAKVFSTYHEEILMRREELLQYAQVAISGLKKNVENLRINSEVEILKSLLYSTKVMSSSVEDDERVPQQDCLLTLEALRKTLSKIRLHTKYTTLMMRNIDLLNEETMESHEYKVHKLKVLLQSITNTTMKTQKRISDYENRKNETQHYRQTKAIEVSLIEKDLIAEIKALEKQKDKLEFKLNKIKTSLSDANTRLHNVKEERDHFKEANNRIIQQLQMKEEQNLTHITSYRRKTNVITAWNKFIDDVWHIQYIIFKQFERNVRIEKVLHLDDENVMLTMSRENIEDEYLQFEIEIINAFNLIDCIEQSCTQDAYRSRF